MKTHWEDFEAKTDRRSNIYYKNKTKGYQDCLLKENYISDDSDED